MRLIPISSVFALLGVSVITTIITCVALEHPTTSAKSKSSLTKRSLSENVFRERDSLPLLVRGSVNDDNNYKSIETRRRWSPRAHNSMPTTGKSSKKSKSSKSRIMETPPDDGDGNITLPTGLPICVVDDRGFPIPENNAAYDNGTVVFSEISEVEAGVQVSTALAGLSAALGTVAAVAGVFVPATAGAALVVVAVIGAVAAILGLVSFILSAFEGPSATEVLLKNEFRKLNLQIDVLSQAIEFFFDQLRIDIADQTLDEINNQLSRMSSAYREYVDASTLNSTDIPDDERNRLQTSYRESFRIACNELDFRPQDIISILYGHTCGEVDRYPNRCNVGGGINTGECKFGTKQRSYLLDKFRLGEGTISRVREFRGWMLSSMMQALYLQAVCLPPLQDVCPSENDPIFAMNMETSLAASNETIAILDEVERCTCPCKYLYLEKVTLSISDQFGTAPEGRIYVGVQRNGEGGKNYVQMGPRFDGNDVDVGVQHPIVVSQADTVWFKVIENDGVFNPDDIYESSSSFNSEAPTDWYMRDCTDYDAVYTSVHNAGDIVYTFKILPATSMGDDQCPDEFCSADKPTCDDVDAYCDFANFACLPKRSGNETCTADTECLSGVCTNDQCSSLLVLEEVCTSNEQCASRFCGILQFANGTVNGQACCPLDSGCQKCDSVADCGSSNCATCQQDGFCKYNCDFALCGGTCQDCAAECFPGATMSAIVPSLVRSY